MSVESACARLMREANLDSEHNRKLRNDADAVADELCREGARIIRKRNRKLRRPAWKSPFGSHIWMLSNHWSLVHDEQHLVLRFSHTAPVGSGRQIITEDYGHGRCTSRDAAMYLGAWVLETGSMERWRTQCIQLLIDLNFPPRN